MNVNDLLNDQAFLVAFWATAILTVFAGAMLIHNRRLKKRLSRETDARYQQTQSHIQQKNFYEDRVAGLVETFKRMDAASEHNFTRAEQAEERIGEMIKAIHTANYQNILVTKLLLRVYPYARLIISDPTKLEAHLQKLTDQAQQKERRRKHRRPATA